MVGKTAETISKPLIQTLPPTHFHLSPSHSSLLPPSPHPSSPTNPPFSFLAASSMAENRVILSQQKDLPIHEQFISLLSKFPFKFPVFNQESKPEVVGGEESKSVGQKPDAVRFLGRSRPINPQPLKVELQESSRPGVSWQAYAVGGFIMLQWLWAKYNEKKNANKGSPDDQESPAEDN